MSETIARIWEEHYRYESTPKTELPAEMMNYVRQELEPLLNDKQTELFRKYRNYCEEYLRLAQESAFCNGYSLATKITAEALLGTEKTIPQELILK